MVRILALGALAALGAGGCSEEAPRGQEGTASATQGYRQLAPGTGLDATIRRLVDDAALRPALAEPAPAVNLDALAPNKGLYQHFSKGLYYQHFRYSH